MPGKVREGGEAEGTKLEREGKKIKEKKKGGEERWMERRGVEPGVGRRRTLRGGGVERESGEIP